MYFMVTIFIIINTGFVASPLAKKVTSSSAKIPVSSSIALAVCH